MTAVFSDPLLRLAWSLPLALLMTPRRPVTVIYHGVPQSSGAMTAAVFERHMRFLSRHCEFVTPADLGTGNSSLRRQRVLLTFDDGLRNNAEVVAPILRRYAAPAVFFVCSRHAAPGRYLWFSYLRALENGFRWRQLTFQGAVYDMTPAARKKSVERLRQALLDLRPHPARMYEALDEELPPLEELTTASERAELYEGMTTAQVGELASDPLFTVGVHTDDHPFLTYCEPGEARRQIASNRRWIEQATGKPCELIAYPAGDYDDAVLGMCQEMGFTNGFAVQARRRATSPLELARMGIYSPSTDILGFKVQWGHLLRHARVRIG